MKKTIIAAVSMLTSAFCYSQEVVIGSYGEHLNKRPTTKPSKTCRTVPEIVQIE